MKALLIVAHGSRSKEANEEVGRLAERIGTDAGPVFDRVVHAFLEIAGPQFDTAIAELAAGGITEIKVFPYFLAAGAHVAIDIPRVIGVAEKAYPDIDFEILPYVGALDGISSLIMEQIDTSSPTD